MNSNIDRLLETENSDPKLEKIRQRILKLQAQNEKMHTNSRKTYWTKLEKRVVKKMSKDSLKQSF